MALFALFTLLLVVGNSNSVFANSGDAGADLKVKFIHNDKTETLDVLKIFPHDPKAFTQGFEIHDGVFWESTGLYGQSTMRTIDMESGKPDHNFELDRLYFGEGMTMWGDSVYQLTWKRGKAFVFDSESLEPTGEFNYTGEGWGLTHNDETFIMSDGSHHLFFRNHENFALIKQVPVLDGGRTIRNLNELEMVGDFVFANVWFDRRIAIIEPESGDVVAWIDCTALKNHEPGSSDVLNGIAYDEASGRLFVTGKKWSNVYELEMPNIHVLRK